MPWQLDLLLSCQECLANRLGLGAERADAAR
jgi:hypothetical protein